ncbi:MAG: hypothetical protein DRI90_21535 [Deltaproteobacteria bacterium]|nr:MAG: hypothetical protein DRI90_21535 [Deltaproteobacteria bacterium]
MTCVCGLGPSTEECCGRYITGGETAPTPEALMRSRYAAYTLEEIDYVVATHDPATRDEVDPDGAHAWSKEAEWEGLSVHEIEGGAEDDEGIVEFTARYQMQGKLVRHRERAKFVKLEGKWFYHDGDMVKAKPMVREGPKIGRNEPCPCGSGKKYKKCCGR